VHGGRRGDARVGAVTAPKREGFRRGRGEGNGRGWGWVGQRVDRVRGQVGGSVEGVERGKGGGRERGGGGGVREETEVGWGGRGGYSEGRGRCEREGD